MEKFHDFRSYNSGIEEREFIIDMTNNYMEHWGNKSIASEREVQKMVDPGDEDTLWMMMANRMISEITWHPRKPNVFADIPAKGRFRLYLLF